MSTTYQQQPSANQLKQEKSHSQPPSACHLITLQHLASPIQPILPTRPTVCLPFVISSLLKTKNTSKFSCFIQYTADYSFESEETAGLKRLFFFYYFNHKFVILSSTISVALVSKGNGSTSNIWNFMLPEISMIDNHLVWLGALSRIIAHQSKLFSTPLWISNIYCAGHKSSWEVLAWLFSKTFWILLRASISVCPPFTCIGPVSYRWWPRCVGLNSSHWGQSTVQCLIFREGKCC